MYTVVGAILLVASFGTYNIISTITHEKTRDIAILKSLGFRDARSGRIFVIEALVIGLVGRGARLDLRLCSSPAASRSLEIKTPFIDYNHLPVIYSVMHYLLATTSRWRRASSRAISRRARRRALHPVDIIRGAT